MRTGSSPIVGCREVLVARYSVLNKRYHAEFYSHGTCVKDSVEVPACYLLNHVKLLLKGQFIAECCVSSQVGDNLSCVSLFLSAEALTTEYRVILRRASREHLVST